MANPKSTAQIAGHPLHPMVVPFPVAFYIGTLIADLIFLGGGDPFWANFAFWSLAAGVAGSAIAGTLGAIDFFGSTQIRAIRSAWWHAVGNGLVSTISVIDLFLRFEAGSVVGSHRYIWLALIVAVMLIFTSWKGGDLVFRHKVGVADEKSV
jgi:uncharacterized membrane protein